MDQSTLQRQGLSIERIAEIERIEAELAKAFVQAAVEYAYARATSAVPHATERQVVAQVVDTRALELAKTRLTDPRQAAMQLPDIEAAKKMMASLDERQVATIRELGGAFAREARTRIDSLAARQADALAPAANLDARTIEAPIVLERPDLAQQAFASTQDRVRQAAELRTAQQQKREAQGKEAAAQSVAAPGAHPAAQPATEAQTQQYSPDDQARMTRKKLDEQQAEREAENIARWNDLAAWEAYRRSRRAQTEIEAGGDPRYWQRYALADDAMVRGLKTPELASDGAVNGATTKRYQPQITQYQTRAVNAEVREELTSEPSMAARTLAGMPVVDRGMEHGFDHLYARPFEPLHGPAADSAA